MTISQFRCSGCRTLCRKRAANQRYCSKAACQRKRRNRWRRERYATDDAYRLTAQASTVTWLAEQGGAGPYFRSYRKRRAQQATPKSSGVSAQKETRRSGAKSDAKTAQDPVTTGHYLLLPAGGAKSDAIVVQLLAIADDLADLQRTTGFSESEIGVRVES